jgi:hypothetical protein
VIEWWKTYGRAVEVRSKRFSSLVVKPGCGTHTLKQSYMSVRGNNKMPWVVEALNHQSHLKSKVQSGDSDSVSDEEGQDYALTHQALRKMHLGIRPQYKRFPTLAKSPLQAA